MKRKKVSASQGKKKDETQEEESMIETELNLPRTISVSEAARRLRVSPPTIRSWVKNGTLPSYKHPVTKRPEILEGPVAKMVSSVAKDLADLDATQQNATGGKPRVKRKD